MYERLARALRDRTVRRIAHAIVLLLAATGLVLATSPAASAGGGLKSIVCGGQKYVGSPATAWRHSDYGGYVGEGCGAGIDYTYTPTGNFADYYLGYSNGTSTVVQAWIPTNFATATMNFNLYICGWYSGTKVINETYYAGWVTLYTVPGAGNGGCPVKIRAWTGQVSLGHSFGLDAIRTHY